VTTLDAELVARLRACVGDCAADVDPDEQVELTLELLERAHDCAESARA
jgi:hypothetical protein